MRPEQSDNNTSSQGDTSRAAEAFAPGPENSWSVISAENRDAIRNILKQTIDVDAILNTKPPDKSITDVKEKSKSAEDNETPAPKPGDNLDDKPKDAEFVGLRLRQGPPEEALKRTVDAMIKDSSDKEKFTQDLKKFADRAKDDEVKKEQVDAVFRQLDNILAGTRTDLTPSAIPQSMRVAMAQRLLTDLANPDKLARESHETKQAHEYRKLDYRFKPEVVTKRIADQIRAVPLRAADA